MNKVREARPPAGVYLPKVWKGATQVKRACALPHHLIQNPQDNLGPRVVGMLVLSALPDPLVCRQPPFSGLPAGGPVPFHLAWGSVQSTQTDRRILH